MSYVIVTQNRTIIGRPFASFAAALSHASHLFGRNPADWTRLNLRIEENR